MPTAPVAIPATSVTGERMGRNSDTSDAQGGDKKSHLGKLRLLHGLILSSETIVRRRSIPPIFPACMLSSRDCLLVLADTCYGLPRSDSGLGEDPTRLTWDRWNRRPSFI